MSVQFCSQGERASDTDQVPRKVRTHLPAAVREGTLARSQKQSMWSPAGRVTSRCPVMKGLELCKFGLGPEGEETLERPGHCGVF